MHIFYKIMRRAEVFLMRKSAEQKHRDEVIRTVVTAVLSGIGVLSVCLFVFGEIAIKVDLSDGIMSVMAQISLAAGCFAAAFTAAKQRGRKGLLSGLCCGGIAFAVIFLLGIIFAGSFSAGGFVSKILTIAVCSAAGGLLGVNSKKKFR